MTDTSKRIERITSLLPALSLEALTEMERHVLRLVGGSAIRQSLEEIGVFPALKESGVEPPHSKAEPPHSKDWPHAPIHRLSENGTYIVTAGTFAKRHYFHGSDRLDLLESTLLTLAKQYGWHVEAWAVFSNHYHFVAHGQPEPDELKRFLSHLHTKTASRVNQFDNTPGRSVWYNFWDTRLTYERSYLARLKYVHQNAVKHGLVRVANQYRWCSAAWFERTATPAQVKTIYSFKTDKVRVVDDFQPEI